MSDYYLLSYNRYKDSKLVGAGMLGGDSIMEMGLEFDSKVKEFKKDHGDDCCLADLRIVKL